MTFISKSELSIDLIAKGKPDSHVRVLHFPTASEVVHALFREGAPKALILAPGDIPDWMPSENQLAEISKLDQTQIGIFTSGTTGEPRLHFHPIQSLLRGLKPIHDAETWGLLYAPDRMAGLQVVFQAAISGANLSAPARTATLVEKIEIFCRDGVDGLSATPSFWRQILGTREKNKLKLRYASVGGEIATQELLDELVMAFPQAQITHVFATTESGPVFSVSDQKSGFPLEYVGRIHKSGVIPRLEAGELVLETSNASGDRKLIPTGDLVEVRNQRVLFVGRKDDLVNIGGNKISLHRIEEAFLSLGVAQDCVARTKPNHILGNAITLDVVWRDGKLSESEVRKLLSDKLPRYALPVSINSIEEITKSSSQKKKRT